MDDKIKITGNLVFGYEDLMKEVDFSQEFTLSDILSVCMLSDIPIHTLESILQCHYILEYAAEMKTKPFEADGEMDYLEVYWWGTKSSWDGEVKPKGIKNYGSMWCFHGMGKLGYVPEDVLKYGELTAKEKKEFRQPMAIEFSPMYKLADYLIKLGSKLHITDYDAEPKEKLDSSVDFQPSITLIELLHAIFYELSFCGSPAQRDKQMGHLLKIVDEVKSGKEKTYSSKEVYDKVMKKIKNTKKGKK